MPKHEAKQITAATSNLKPALLVPLFFCRFFRESHRPYPLKLYSSSNVEATILTKKNVKTFSGKSQEKASSFLLPVFDLSLEHNIKKKKKKGKKEA